MVEQFPFKEAVEGSNPSGLTEIWSVSIVLSKELFCTANPSGLTLAPSSSGLGRRVFIPKILGSNPNGVTYV
ncbi:MAG: hypothetical protein ACD_13C00044G0005 [uncultured bacterium]|nr:MAG: hypothetical protein ACD_13C00044G0005 [uncultured bacterium]